MKRFLPLLLLVVSAVPLSAAFRAASSGGSIHVDVFTADIQSEAASPDFASFSVEVQCAPELILDGPSTSPSTQPRESYVNLMRFLASVGSDAGNVGPNIRIGGNSADETYFYTSRNDTTPLPPGFTGHLFPDEIASYRHASLWNGTVVVDLAFRNATDPSNTVAHALAAQALLASSKVLVALEVGNEPELYSRNGIRPEIPPYNYSMYTADFARYVAALRKAGVILAVNQRLIQGGVLCCMEWLPDVADFVSANADVLSTFSKHFYPLAGATATIAELLDDKSANMTFIRGPAAAAKSVGVPFVIGEGNSAFDGGREGVSNTLAAALWSIDIMFSALRNGASRWNFHGCTGGPYTPIAIDLNVATARPLYYGMWFFTRAIRNGARIVRHEVRGGSSSMPVKFWATRTASTLRLIAIHKSPDATVPAVEVTFNVSAGGDDIGTLGRVMRLYNRGLPSVAATSSLYFGGLTFEDSTTGLPSGVPSNETVAVVRGELVVTVQPATAVLIEIDLSS